MAIRPIDPNSPFATQRSRAQTQEPHDTQMHESEHPQPEDSPYRVGYGKPPRHTQFKPGRSGNPRGRPKGARGLKTIVHDLLTTKVAVRTPMGERKISRIEAVVQKTIELAMKGNQKALAELIRLYSLAVPDAPAQSATASSEELTQTDLAILEELKASWLADAGEPL